ncbi:MAG: response regulator [Sphingobacteriales bacterium]|nr:MAG: response regulator [Sphingobacteriales bacterium]
MKRIIIVEDDPDIRDALDVILGSTYNVAIYSGAAPLLEEDYELPDLYIIDKQLSGVSGLSLCEYLKGQEDTMRIPVILLSASPDIVKLAKSSGADDALEKPFKVNILRAMVRYYVDK